MSCAHHWRIDEANGPTVKGHCLKCGAAREFNAAEPNEGYSHTERYRTSQARALASRKKNKR